mgnify:CR=1 FL=1
MLPARFLGCLCATTGLISADALISSAWAQAKMSFEIYGFAQADASIDTNRMDPAWDDAFRPSKIPSEPRHFGGDGGSEPESGCTHGGDTPRQSGRRIEHGSDGIGHHQRGHRDPGLLQILPETLRE